jgi:hypothetical protein
LNDGRCKRENYIAYNSNLMNCTIFLTLNKLSVMETLLVKVSERQKANMLVELLKSMDFIESVDYMDDLKSFKEAFDNLNEIALSTDLKNMTLEDINKEIKEYRLEKRSRGN